MIVSQDSSSTFCLDRASTSTLGTPASSRRTTVASGSASPVLLLADGEGGNRTRSITILAVSHRCEGDHYGNCFLTMDILASNF